MTFLILLARTAGAGIVAPYFFTDLALCRLAGFACAGAIRHRKFALLLALEFLLQRVDRRGRLARGNRDFARLRAIAPSAAVDSRHGLGSAFHRRRRRNGTPRLRRRVHWLSVGSENL